MIKISLLFILVSSLAFAFAQTCPQTTVDAWASRNCQESSYYLPYCAEWEISLAIPHFPPDGNLTNPVWSDCLNKSTVKANTDCGPSAFNWFSDGCGPNSFFGPGCYAWFQCRYSKK